MSLAVVIKGPEGVVLAADSRVTLEAQRESGQPIHVNYDNARGWSPYVSPDGDYFFFMATRTNEIEQRDWNYLNLKALHNSPGNGNADIYWVDAGFFEILKEKALVE